MPLAISLDGDVLAGGVAPDGTVVELAAGRWLLNPGSVGQPRDGDPRAGFLLLEPGRRATFHRVDYPIERTQAEMRERGLPEALAARPGRRSLARERNHFGSRPESIPSRASAS